MSSPNSTQRTDRPYPSVIYRGFEGAGERTQQIAYGMCRRFDVAKGALVSLTNEEGGTPCAIAAILTDTNRCGLDGLNLGAAGRVSAENLLFDRREMRERLAARGVTIDELSFAELFDAQAEPGAQIILKAEQACEIYVVLPMSRDGLLHGGGGRLSVSAGEIVRLAARGEGVTADGRHVALAAPGDVLEAEGVIRPGPHHAIPPCRHFPCCGGCQLQHVDDAAYRTFLIDRVTGALGAQRLEVPTIREPHLSPPRSRRRATLRAERIGRKRTMAGSVALAVIPPFVYSWWLWHQTVKRQA